MKGQIVTSSGAVLIAVFVLAAVVGWVANVVKLIGMDFDPITALLIVRVIGIFVPPVGAIAGYL